MRLRSTPIPSISSSPTSTGSIVLDEIALDREIPVCHSAIPPSFLLFQELIIQPITAYKMMLAMPTMREAYSFW
jgi:hypothetical protein